MHRRGRHLFSLGAVAVLIVAAMLLTSDIVSFGGSATAGVTPTSAPRARTFAQETGADATPMTDATEVFAAVSPAVVTVLSESGGQTLGSGTGFIIDDDGDIVTNWHVVNGGEQFEVIYSDGTIHDAELIGSDNESDLAVVKVDDEVPATVGFADSDALLPGEAVLAIGSPLGAFANTVTQGIVSAINRDFPLSQQPQGGAASTYNNLVQHDAAINPGNSGGPLVNLSGEVVGVNTLGIPTDEQGQPVQGLFFAIPSNTVALIAATLIEDGRVVYPYVGVEYRDNSPAVAAEFDLDASGGVVITSVPDGPAADAGLQEGDIILQIGDYPLNAQTPFSEALFNYDPGDTVTLLIIRDGEEQEIEITFGERPDDI
jgi:2-alkenal reductase